MHSEATLHDNYTQRSMFVQSNHESEVVKEWLCVMNNKTNVLRTLRPVRSFVAMYDLRLHFEGNSQYR